MKDSNSDHYLHFKIDFFDYIFFGLLTLAIITSFLQGKDNLIYIMPLVTVSIILKYIVSKKKKSNIIFITALCSVVISDILISTSFKGNYLWINIMLISFLLCSILTLKKYLHAGKLKSFLSLSMLIGVGLVTYLLYITLEIIVQEVPNLQMFTSYLCAVSILIFLFTITIIYTNNNYSSGTMLLASGIFYLFQVVLTIINEFLHMSNSFTAIIILCHFLAIYLLTRFLINTKPINDEDIKEQFI